MPADEFDAEPDAVLRFAAQLAATERRVAGWVDRRASAIRIRLAADAERRLVYLIEVPERASEALRTALRSFEGVEERPAAEVLGKADGGQDKRAVLRTELVLARPSVEPLTRLAPKPDPLQPFAAAIGRLGSGEDASVCVDLLPASGFRAARLRRRLRREARRIHGERRDWAALLNGEEHRRRRPDPQEQVERRGAVQAVDAKLRDSGELFEAQILLRSAAPTRGQAKAAMSGLLAAFRPLAGRNYLKASGLPIAGLAFLGSDLPLRRGSFDRRFATGLFRPARKTILTARELAGFLKPPSVHCGERDILRSGALLSPPPDLPAFEKGRGDLIPLGQVSTESGERIVGVQTADTFFTYIAGRSRYGKTEAAIAQFAHIVRADHGGLFLDPHGDGLERVEPYLADLDPERVVRIDLGPGSAPAAQPGWNLFEFGGDAIESEARVEAVVDAFASALEWGERSTRAINLTTQAAAALAAIAGRLDAELAPTIFQIPTLLSDAEWREAALPFLPAADRRFWTDRFPLLASEAITPVTNLVDRLRRSPQIKALLGQSQSTYRVREAMDEGKIVLACPGTGGTRDRLIANLLLFDLLHAARGRADLPPEKRKPFWVFLDEVQSYDGAASGNLAALLEQSAKFGLRAVLLNQNPERLSAATLNALLTNRSHLLASTLNSHAAALVTKEWGKRVNPEALTRLERFRFIAQVTHEGRLSAPFALGGAQVEDAIGEPATKGSSQKVRRASSAPERSAEEVAAHLDGLDDRILAALKERGDSGETAARASRPEPPRAPDWEDERDE
ncbi:MAG: ATP-binding protein [Solirubrobacterales bacterium]